jgi:adenine deaminase
MTKQPTVQTKDPRQIDWVEDWLMQERSARVAALGGEIETFLDSIAKLEPKEQVHQVREMMQYPAVQTSAFSSRKLMKWVRKYERYM